MPLKVLHIVLAIFATATLALSQNELKDEIKASFNTDVIWMDEYHGLLDDKHKIYLIIANDDTSTVVKSQYVSSREVKSYEMERRGDSLLLHEMLKYGRSTGGLVLVPQGREYVGHWQDEKGVAKYDVRLWPVSLQVDCGDRKFYKHFSGKVNGTDVQLELWRNKTTGASVAGKQFLLSCITADCKALKAERLQLGNRRFNNVTLKQVNDKLLIADHSGEHILTLDYQYRQECHERIAHAYRWTVSLPRLESPEFMRFIEDEINKLKPKYDGPASQHNADRDAYHQKLWVDVTLFDGNMISGYINQQKSWEAGVTEVPFIFNLKKGKVIKQDEVLKTTHTEVFKSEDIQCLVLAKEGIRATGKFDPIYGQEVKVLPYDEAVKLSRDKGLRDWIKNYGH